jgi:hypothetical protein
MVLQSNGRAGLSRRNVGLYILAAPNTGAPLSWHGSHWSLFFHRSVCRNCTRLCNGTRPTRWAFCAAGILMSIDIWLHVSERHEHLHVHEPLEHEHLHYHEEHHQHEHSRADPPGEPHAHWHRHAPLTHNSHPHTPISIIDTSTERACQPCEYLLSASEIASLNRKGQLHGCSVKRSTASQAIRLAKFD